MRRLCVDGTNLAHRAYFASPGDHDSLFKSWVEKLTRLHRPTETIIAMDAPRSFRRDIDPNYKAGRSPKPRDLVVYLDKLRDAGTLWYDGLEADDVIAIEAATHDGEVIAVSGDLDLCAIVSHRVSLVRPPEWDKVWGPEDVFRKVGVWADQICAYKSLAGDTSDNIRGATGIGPVKAKRLLGTYGTFEGVLPYLTPNQQEEAKAAWKLVALRTEVPCSAS